MKKIIALALPFMVLVSVVVTFAMLEARRVPDWSVELSDYIERSRLPAETIAVQTIVDARKPWNFNATMGQPVPSGGPWGIEELPYPPEAMRCVLLERSRKPAAGVKAETRRQIVYVGYHTDRVWRTGWLVHAGPKEPFTQELVTHLGTIGCDLSLE